MRQHLKGHGYKLSNVFFFLVLPPWLIGIYAALTANLRMGKALQARNCFDVFKFFSWGVRALRMARVLLLRRSRGLYFLFCKKKEMC